MKPNQKNLSKYIQRIEAAEKWRDGGFRTHGSGTINVTAIMLMC